MVCVKFLVWVVKVTHQSLEIQWDVDSSAKHLRISIGHNEMVISAQTFTQHVDCSQSLCFLANQALQQLWFKLENMTRNSVYHFHLLELPNMSSISWTLFTYCFWWKCASPKVTDIGSVYCNDIKKKQRKKSGCICFLCTKKKRSSQSFNQNATRFSFPNNIMMTVLREKLPTCFNST